MNLAHDFNLKPRRSDHHAMQGRSEDAQGRSKDGSPREVQPRAKPNPCKENAGRIWIILRLSTPQRHSRALASVAASLPHRHEPRLGAVPTQTEPVTVGIGWVSRAPTSIRERACILQALCLLLSPCVGTGVGTGSSPSQSRPAGMSPQFFLKDVHQRKYLMSLDGCSGVGLFLFYKWVKK